MDRRPATLVLVLGSSLALGGAAWPSPADAGGGLYRWIDPRGVIHYTDVPKHERFEALEPRVSTPFARRRTLVYDRVIARASARYGVPAAMVKAVIAAESAFDPRAVSPKGAMGLMQLMPATADQLGVDHPFLAEQNVYGGTRYLRTLHDRYRSWTNTLAAYNAGPDAVDRHGGVPPYRETREYVKRVLSYYRRFHGDFAP